MTKIEISIHKNWELGASGMKYQAFYDTTSGILDEETVGERSRDYMEKYAVVELGRLVELFKKLAVKILNETYRVNLTGDEIKITRKKS